MKPSTQHTMALAIIALNAITCAAAVLVHDKAVFALALVCFVYGWMRALYLFDQEGKNAESQKQNDDL